jgi:hypothetical protein
MPYSMSFRLATRVADSDKYINDCCIGGDRLLDKLEPDLRILYDAVELNQEDWGWFAWTEKAGVKLAVDIYNEDPATMRFRVHITSRKSRWVLPDKVEDTPELEELKDLVVAKVLELPALELATERVDSKYMPVQSAA